MRRAAGEMDALDPMNFRNVADSLIKAKKDKMNFMREAQKQLAMQEAAEKQLSSGKNKMNLTASMRMNQQPTIDYSTFAGKLKILRDVKE